MFRDRTITCLVLAVPLIAICAWLNHRFLGHPESPMSEGPFYINKVHAPAEFDLVLCGNSRVLRGISTESMKPSLPGARILNLGISGACLTPQMYGEIEDKLDGSGTSKAVLLGVEPGTIEQYSSSNSKLNIELGRSEEAIFLALHAGPILRWFEPAHPTAFINRVSLQIRGPTTAQPLYHCEYHRDGWAASFRVPESREHIVGILRNEHGSEVDLGPRIPLPYECGLYDQVERWTALGVRVFGVRVPTNESIRDYENARYDFNEVSVAVQFEKAGGIWIRVNPDNFHCYDGSHLHKDSAIKFSGLLARRISRTCSFVEQ